MDKSLSEYNALGQLLWVQDTIPSSSVIQQTISIVCIKADLI